MGPRAGDPPYAGGAALEKGKTTKKKKKACVTNNHKPPRVYTNKCLLLPKSLGASGALEQPRLALARLVILFEQLWAEAASPVSPMIAQDVRLGLFLGRPRQGPPEPRCARGSRVWSRDGPRRFPTFINQTSGEGVCKKGHSGSSCCGPVETNLTRNHEVLGSIPDLAQ